MTFENEKIWLNDSERTYALRQAGMQDLTQSTYMGKKRGTPIKKKNISFKWNFIMTLGTVGLLVFHLYT